MTFKDPSQHKKFCDSSIVSKIKYFLCQIEVVKCDPFPEREFNERITYCQIHILSINKKDTVQSVIYTVINIESQPFFLPSASSKGLLSSILDSLRLISATKT